MGTLRYGITICNAGPAGDPRTIADLAVLAEEAGWDGVFVEDYLAMHGQLGQPTYDPWIVLAAIATRTTRIRIGTMVTPLPRRRPWKVAAEAVALDHLSGGRLILGFGAGSGGDPSFAAVGDAASPRVLAGRLDEGLEILAGLWTGQPTSFAGEHYTVDGLQLAPTPVQRPRVPIWIGGDLVVKGVRDRVARWDGSCTFSTNRTPNTRQTPDDVRDVIGLVERHRDSLDGFDICVGGSERKPDWEQERAYVRSLAEAGLTWWHEWVPPGEVATAREAVARGPLRID